MESRLKLSKDIYISQENKVSIISFECKLDNENIYVYNVYKKENTIFQRMKKWNSDTCIYLRQNLQYGIKATISKEIIYTH